MIDRLSLPLIKLVRVVRSFVRAKEVIATGWRYFMECSVTIKTGCSLPACLTRWSLRPNRFWCKCSLRLFAHMGNNGGEGELACPLKQFLPEPRVTKFGRVQYNPRTDLHKVDTSTLWTIARVFTIVVWSRTGCGQKALQLWTSIWNLSSLS